MGLWKLPWTIPYLVGFEEEEPSERFAPDPGKGIGLGPGGGRVSD